MSEAFGSYITNIRNTHKVSISALAQGTGIPFNDLERIEKRLIHASRDQIFRLANYFNLGVRELLQLSQESRINELSKHGGRESSERHQASLMRSPALYARRIENMQRDLFRLADQPINIMFHEPAVSLRPFIDSIVYCQGHDLGHPFERALPDGMSQLQIVVGDGGRSVLNANGKQKHHISKAWVMGINSVPITFMLSKVRAVIYVRFAPGGLYAFTRMHQSQLSNQIVDAVDVFGRSIAILWEILAKSYDSRQSIQLVEKYFMQRLDDVVESSVVSYMLNHIYSPMTQLAKRTGYSSKYLTKIFQKFVGVGPKTFQRIDRFHSAVSNLNHLPHDIAWSDVVFQQGYHDQAHFIKDFKAFSGLTPQHYLSWAPSCSRYLHTSQYN